MAKYDMSCGVCNLSMEISCPMAERESQTCPQCGKPLTPLFSPPTVINIPKRFHIAASDQFGQYSEKDWRKENPDAEIISRSRTYKSDAQKHKEERAKIIKEGQEVERTLIARGQLKKETVVESGSMTSDV